MRQNAQAQNAHVPTPNLSTVFGRKTAARQAIIDAPADASAEAPAVFTDPSYEIPDMRVLRATERMARARWRGSRNRNVPWRSLALVAALSFAVGALMLPNAMGPWGEAAMYAMVAMAFFVSLAGKKKV